MSEVKKYTSSEGSLDYLEILNSPNNPTVVMLHGYGANMRDLAPIASIVPQFKSFNWIFPDGPIKVPIGPMMFGRAWFPLDMQALNIAMATGSFENLFSEKVPEGMSSASSLLQNFIQEKVYGPTILAGFSQGSMMACDLALNSKMEVKALVLLSSTLVAKERLRDLLAKKSIIPTFQTHGTHDPVLPISMARALKEEFTTAEWPIKYHEFNGGHEIPPQALQELVSFLGEI